MPDMRENGKITKYMDKVSSGILMEIFLKESGKMIRLMDLAYMFTQMDQNTKDIGKMIYRMDMELKYGNKIYNNYRTDGPKFEGNYKQGKKDGFGNYIWSDGSKFSGEWV